MALNMPIIGSFLAKIRAQFPSLPWPNLIWGPTEGPFQEAVQKSSAFIEPIRFSPEGPAIRSLGGIPFFGLLGRREY